jgi:hypothetical protein
MRWTANVGGMGDKKNAYRVTVVKPDENIPLGRSRCRWVDNIKKYIR